MKTLSIFGRFIVTPADGRKAFGNLNVWKTACAVVLLCVATARVASTQIISTTLASFDGTDGSQPEASLIQATDGNFYGTTYWGGANVYYGTVFKITPAGALTTLHSFCPLSHCSDGERPSGLVQGSDGNFYGTTFAGGGNGFGTVFKITPAGTLTTLYDFCSQTGCTDGNNPQAGLVQGRDGNFYGTTSHGGSHLGQYGYGTVFKITPTGTLTTLYNFCPQWPNCSGGLNPQAGLVQGSDGNFYGTTPGGGDNNDGTVFKITPAGALTTLYSFGSKTDCADGVNPQAALVQGSDGNFYGTTYNGGFACGYGAGTVFKITPQGTLTTLNEFFYGGWNPQAGLVQGTDGNFYGTASAGGLSTSGCGDLGCGTVFKITPTGALTTLYYFCPQSGCPDGEQPEGGLVQGTAGNFYGTTHGGGANADGTIFSLSGILPNFSLAALGEQVDYFGEGKADFTVWRPSNGTWYSIDGSGKSLTKQWGLPTDIPVVGDYDGDGKTDFAVWRPSTGTWYVVQSSNGQVVKQQWGTNGDIPVPGDYDGDGATDYAVWRPSTGTWYILQSSGGIIQKQWGWPTDIPVPGDYDGDGKTDIAVWRPSTGTWYIIQSSNGQVVKKQWGWPTDKPVPGDYDGDGKTDIAVWRPSTGYWYVIQSSNGQVAKQQWGTNGDVPVARDYDGDGKADCAVWRPSNGYWYVLESSNGQVVKKQWGTSTDVPMNKPIGQ